MVSKKLSASPKNADFQEIDIDNIYNSSSMLKKKCGLDTYGLPEELSQDIAISDEDSDNFSSGEDKGG